MTAAKPYSRLTAAAALAALGFAAASCSTVESLVPSAAKGDTPYVSPSVHDADWLAVRNANRPVKESEKVARLPLGPEDIDCPTVDIAEGRASMRSGGADSASVRYQFNIVNTARSCEPAGGQASLKVGVSGNVLVGPAGAPGAYGAGLRIAVVRQTDHKTVFSKVYRAEATTGGGLEGKFQIVSEPIVLPLDLHLADLYAIEIGFEGGGGQAPRRLRHARR